ncbi:MAG TPA: hypothetical protein VM577_09280 [Anaerovoracaceae bacterium]|nr:hypothetical protein [Anaerovoracaceae bacterium]
MVFDDGENESYWLTGDDEDEAMKGLADLFIDWLKDRPKEMYNIQDGKISTGVQMNFQSLGFLTEDANAVLDSFDEFEEAVSK